jgi:general secretion pathway protein K
MTEPHPQSTAHRGGAARRRAADGFIIVAVLWILGALATLASIYAIYIIDTAFVSKARDERVVVDGMIQAALELTAYQVTSKPGERQGHGAFSFRLGNAVASAQFRSEGGRIDLNQAPKELLAGLFMGFGARPDDAVNYADRIVAWRTKPQQGADPEASLYHAAGRRYVPRGAPFPSSGELWLVLGLPDALLERIMPFITVFSGKPQVSALDAPPEVLAALPGMTPETLRTFLVQRAATPPQNGQSLLPLLGAAETHASVEPSKSLRVTVQVALDNGRQLNADAVIYVPDSDNQPYYVLSWRDGLDE